MGFTHFSFNDEKIENFLKKLKHYKFTKAHTDILDSEKSYWETGAQL